MIYKVIKEDGFSYIKADSFVEATKRSADKYGSDNIKEVFKIESVCNDWFKSYRRSEARASWIYHEGTGLNLEDCESIVAVHTFSVGVIAERIVNGQKQYETIVKSDEFKSDDLDGIIDCLWNEYAKFELCEDRSLS